MIAVGQWFGQWFMAAAFLYGFYKDWQQKKADKATAKAIIKQVVAAGGFGWCVQEQTDG
jgi:hypothetical protein